MTILDMSILIEKVRRREEIREDITVVSIRMLRNEPVETLCRNVKNFILKIGEDYIIMRSERSKRGAP
ncbi:MAG: hypothetical protein J7K49_03425 [Thaumarchaeota archaeon]|nr:hypothetical protein [Nitrososphaerota archaeon]